MNRISIFLAAALVGLGGCSSESPRPSEDADYSSSDVQPPPIQQVAPPFLGSFVAIVPFVNKTLANYKELGNSAPDIIAAYALDAGFRVAEGQKGQLNEVMDELNFQQTDFVNPQSAAKIGQMYGAKYVLVGAVTDYRVTKAKGKRNFDALGLVSVGGGEEALVYDVQVSSRIIDVATREVICADPGTAIKQKYEVGGRHVKVLGVGTESSQSIDTQDESMGKVLKLAFAKSMNKLIQQANRRAPAYMPQPQYQPPPQGYQPPPQGYQPPPQGYQPPPQGYQQPAPPPQQPQGGYQPAPGSYQQPPG
jgi:curli biogenesis system outer membrane secretion channel CsgG